MLKPWQAILLSLTLLTGGGLSWENPAPAQAQNQVPAPMPEGQQLAMTLLPIVHEKELTYIITPKGFKIQVPGTGVAKNAPAVAVYQDPARNFWYINKKGEPTEVKPEVVQSAMAQLSAQMNVAREQAQAMQGGPPGQMMPPGQMAPGQMVPGQMPPQMMMQQPGQAPVQQTTIVQQPGTASSGTGTAAMLTGINAAAAGMNLAGGILNASSGYGYGGIPYGRPVYGAYDNGHHNYYYNNSSGNKTYVNANKSNSAYLNEFNKQGNWANRNDWSKNIHSGVQPISQPGEHRFGEEGGRRFGGGRRFR